ncbi:MAG: sulfatase [Deltaproteobacteria bacterium]|nr:sulfatase [Deltaproteobacteria bacterium]
MLSQSRSRPVAPDPTAGLGWIRFAALGVVVVSLSFAVRAGPGAVRPDEAARAERATGSARALLRLADGRLPNILLLSIDTLRGDHVGYDESGPRDLTPSIDALAKQGTAFLAVTTPAPATRPSVAALFTGTYPGTNPVYNNTSRLTGPVPTLAEILRRAGYHTAALVGNSTLRSENGFARGFDTYESVFVAGRRVSIDSGAVARAEEWLRNAARPPWLLWLHLMDPHGPYDSAPASELPPHEDGDRLPDRILPRAPVNVGLGVIPRYQAIAGVKRASAYRARYRAEVRHTDAQVGRLLATLAELGLEDDTLVVLTADHGEGLGEHDYYFQHGWFPYEHSVHVPLLFRLPGRVPADEKEEVPLSVADVLPTLLGGLGMPRPVVVEGRDVSSVFAGADLDEIPLYTVSILKNQMSAVRLGKWKLVHTPAFPPPVPDDPWKDVYAREERFALYDLEADPEEAADVSSEHPEQTARLRELLLAWEKEHGVPRHHREVAETGVDPATAENLRALGYLD